jgi:hypothetical protein
MNSPLNRRSFLGKGSQAVSGMALATLLNPDQSAARSYQPIAPKAKRIIYLFQSGGPPQHDLFDHKPHLDKVHGQEVPESVFNGQRLTGMTAGQSSFPAARSIF